MRRRMREDRPEGQASRHHYQMREKLIAIGDDFYIQNELGERVFFVDGKVLRMRHTLLFKDMQGRELLKIQEKFLHVRDTMDIEQNGRVAAKVHSALVTPLRDRYKIDIPGGADMEAQGDFLHHEYEIRQNDRKIAEVSKKWFRVADTYGVEVDPAEDAILILAITVCIDQMSHPD